LESKKENNSLISNSIIKKYKIQVKKEKNINSYIIKNINFNNYNSLQDIKFLLYFLLEIPIENQNLYCKEFPTLFYNYINNITEETLDINFENILSNNLNKYYKNIPIDFDIINNRFNYIINTYEKNSYLNDINTDILEFNLFNLEDIISDRLLINNEIQKDDELLNIIYLGFIEKYFPYYDENLLLLYLSNENKYLEYPYLKYNFDFINNKNNNLSKIYNTKKISNNIKYYYFIFYTPPKSIKYLLKKCKINEYSYRVF
jgi:hypothetical protein